MRFIANISDHTWSMTDDAVFPTQLICEIGFTSNEDGPVIFDNLSFGLEGVCADKSVSIVEPAEGVSYISTDQDLLTSLSINEVRSDDVWELTVWAENAGIRFEETFSVTVPRRVQPYPSWTWDETEKMWTPPVSYPDDDKLYMWNEKDQQWKEYVLS